jgi:hypothetical protein
MQILVVEGSRCLVIRVKERLATDGQTYLEAHLGVAHEFAVLFAVVRDRDSG